MVQGSAQTSEFQERLHVIDDPKTGLKGVIAIHSTVLGPAAGGCRFWHYPEHSDLAEDALRLSRGMSYKNALAGLPFGGGKAVLQRPLGAFNREAMFRAFGEAVAGLEGRYITAEDVGTTIADMRAVRHCTSYVAGLDAAPDRAGGDPSPWTALGVFESMKRAAKVCLQSDLKGLRVAVQGAGNVGIGLCRLLADAGAQIIVADIVIARSKALADKWGAQAVGSEDIFQTDADIFAPCALGGVLNRNTIPLLKAKLICGGANNQILAVGDGDLLLERGISYAPDYVVNAGGIINVCAEYLGETTQQVRTRVQDIPNRLELILRQAQRESRPPNVVADTLAEHIISQGRAGVAA